MTIREYMKTLRSLDSIATIDETKESKTIAFLVEKTKSGNMVWERYLDMDKSYVAMIGDNRYVWFHNRLEYNQIIISTNVDILLDAIKEQMVILEEQRGHDHNDMLSQIYNEILTA